MNDKQKLAVLIEALQQIRNGKRGVDSETANAALDRICNKESELVKTGLSQIKNKIESECSNGEIMFNVDYRQYEFAVKVLVDNGWKNKPTP